MSKEIYVLEQYDWIKKEWEPIKIVKQNSVWPTPSIRISTYILKEETCESN